MIPLKLFLLFLLMGCLKPALADDPKATFLDATAQLEAGDAQTAVNLYQKLSNNGSHAPELYHNLAVAHDLLDQQNQALANAYRSLILKPSEASYWTTFETIAEKTGVASLRRKNLIWGIRAIQWHKPLAIAACILFWSGVVLLLGGFKNSVAQTFAILCLAFMAIAGVGATILYYKVPSSRAAWLTEDEALPLLASHTEGAPEVGQLRPLEEIRIQTTRSEWANVFTSQERAGWVRKQAISRLFPWQP